MTDSSPKRLDKLRRRLRRDQVDLLLVASEPNVRYLTGFTGETKEQSGVTLYGNKAFPGGFMAMPNTALAAGAVTYADGTEASLENEAEDVAAFLMWAAEPKMMIRKESGFKAVLLLGLLSVMLYLTNKRLWANVKGKKIV